MATFSRTAELRWDGTVMDGAGRAKAGSGTFDVPVTFPRTSGEPGGHTTPEELLAASHATCYGIALQSLIGRRGGHARRVIVTATITAEKSSQGIRIQSSHLRGVVEELEAVDEAQLQEIARESAEECTISIALRDNIAISHDVTLENPEKPLQHPD
jgi:osmotically inducible protein OsmC